MPEAGSCTEKVTVDPATDATSPLGGAGAGSAEVTVTATILDGALKPCAFRANTRR